MKKVGKTTGPFRYDLNQIPYYYTMELVISLYNCVIYSVYYTLYNRFKGLDLIDRVPEELWTEVRDTVQEAVIKTIPKKKKCKKSKRLSEEALQIAEKRREAKDKEKRKDIPI